MAIPMSTALGLVFMMAFSGLRKVKAFYRKDVSMVTQYPLVEIDSRPATLPYTRYPMADMVSEQVTIGI